MRKPSNRHELAVPGGGVRGGANRGGMRMLTPAAQHLRDARNALRACDAGKAARHFVRAVDRLPPRAPGRDVALWGLIDACRRHRDYGAAASACNMLQRNGQHTFYRTKAQAWGAALTAWDERGSGARGPAAVRMDPVERYACRHLQGHAAAGRFLAAWSAFLWSIDTPPAGLDATAAWGEALATLDAVAGGQEPPAVPTLHFACLWRALAQPEDGLDWLARYGSGASPSLTGAPGPGREPDAGAAPGPEESPFPRDTT